MSLARLAAAFCVGTLVSWSVSYGADAPRARVDAPWFEPVPFTPVIKKPRRAPYAKPKPPPRVELMEEQPRTDWLALLNQLPKDAGGLPDWVKALNEKMIEPRPAVDPKITEEQPELDLDVDLVPKEMAEFKVVYPHKIHTRLFACANCHTGIFQMERGADPITMEKIFGGEYCGRCHGKVAFDPATSCPRCHVEMPK